MSDMPDFLKGAFTVIGLIVAMYLFHFVLDTNFRISALEGYMEAQRK